jgi:predicted GNAT superfamily acetyltransferase
LSAPFQINDLHGQSLAREELLAVSNASARETSLLSRQRFDHLIERARIALFIPPAAAFLLAFEQSDDYDGGHFLWFKSRYDKFLYIDRVVVAEPYRRRQLGRMLYAGVLQRAAEWGSSRVVCEVNLYPPNPASDHFHAAQGFHEVGRATFDGGAKTVRYLAASV